MDLESNSSLSENTFIITQKLQFKNQVFRWNKQRDSGVELPKK